MGPRALRLTSSLIALVFVATACSAPPVAVRRTAIAPLATPPTRTGRPLDSGEVRFAAEIDQSFSAPHATGDRVRVAGISIYDEGWVPDEEDPGVRIPQTQIGASAYVGLGPYFELGGQFLVGPNGNAAANFPGYVLDFDGGPSFRMGPGLRANIPVSERFAISLGAEFDFMRVPQATFICRNAHRIGEPYSGDPSEPLTGWCTTNEEFDLKEIEEHLAMYATTMFEPVVMLNDTVSLIVHGGVSTGVRNIGFDPYIERADESTLKMYATPFVGVGAEARLRNFFVVAGFDFLIPAIAEVGPMPVLSLTMGGRVPGRTDRAPYEVLE